MSPDSKHLVVDFAEDNQVGLDRLGLRRDGRITGDGYGEFVVVPGWEDRQNRTWINKMVVAPGGASVFVQFASFADERWRLRQGLDRRRPGPASRTWRWSLRQSLGTPASSSSSRS